MARKARSVSYEDGKTPQEGRVVPLPEEVTEGAIEPAPPPTPPGRMHGLAIGGMALSALLGVVALLALVTVTWPADLARLITTLIIAAGVVFITCASAAVLTAARDTYGTERSKESGS